MKDNFKSYIKSHYQQADIPLDVDELWNGIEQKLDKKKRKLLFWWLVHFIGLTIVAIILIPIFINEEVRTNVSTHLHEGPKTNNNLAELVKTGQVIENENHQTSTNKINNVLEDSQTNDQTQAPIKAKLSPLNFEKSEKNLRIHLSVLLMMRVT